MQACRKAAFSNDWEGHAVSRAVTFSHLKRRSNLVPEASLFRLNCPREISQRNLRHRRRQFFHDPALLLIGEARKHRQR